MNMITNNLYVDFSNYEDKVQIAVQQGEHRARKLVIHVLDDQRNYSMESDCSCRIQLDKPDGTTIIRDSQADEISIVSFNPLVVEYILDKNDCSVSGLLKVKFSVMSSGKNVCVLRSTMLKMRVDGGLTLEKDIISSSEYRRFEDLLQECADNADSARTYADSAERCMDAANEAAEKAAEAPEYALKAQSYAVGTSNVRDGEATDNSKYYYEQAKNLYDNIEFSGYVTGLKGDAESSYRTGNVNLTPNHIGALPAGGTAANSNKLAGMSPGHWDSIPYIDNYGVMEIGKYIDFHRERDDGVDHIARITADESGLSLTGITTGTFSGSLSGNASSANALTSSAGNSTTPVYFSDGKPSACTYTLGAACAKEITDSTSAAAIKKGSNVPTERDIYYGLPTINGTHSYTSETEIYAPTSAGNAGYILMSNGSGSPSWKENGTILYDGAWLASSSSNGLEMGNEKEIYRYKKLEIVYGVSPSKIMTAVVHNNYKNDIYTTIGAGSQNVLSSSATEMTSQQVGYQFQELHITGSSVLKHRGYGFYGTINNGYIQLTEVANKKYYWNIYKIIGYC